VNEEVDVLNQALERMQQEMNDQRVQIATLIAVQSRGGLEPRNEQEGMFKDVSKWQHEGTWWRGNWKRYIRVLGNNNSHYVSVLNDEQPF
jgi:hypothetical protein